MSMISLKESPLRNQDVFLYSAHKGAGMCLPPAKWVLSGWLPIVLVTTSERCCSSVFSSFDGAGCEHQPCERQHEANSAHDWQ